MTTFLKFWLLPVLAIVPFSILVIWYKVVLVDKSTQTRKTLFNWKKLIGLYVFSLLFVYALVMITIHQFSFIQLHFAELLDNSTELEAMQVVQGLFDEYGERHRTIGHGMLHGFEAGVFLGLFFVGTIAMVEGWAWRKFFNYFIPFLLVSMIGGGLVCQFL